MAKAGENMAAVIASNSFYIGGNWGFILENNSDYEEIFKVLRKDNVEMHSLKNGLLVFCNPNYLYQVVSQIEDISEEVLQMQKLRPQYEIKEFQKFLTQTLKGTSKYAKDIPNMPNAKMYTIGLYSCNNLHKIRLNCVEYPAYSLTLSEAYTELLKLGKYKKVGIVDENNNIRELKSVDSSTLLSCLEISNTLTGVFLTVILEG